MAVAVGPGPVVAAGVAGGVAVGVPTDTVKQRGIADSLTAPSARTTTMRTVRVSSWNGTVTRIDVSDQRLMGAA